MKKIIYTLIGLTTAFVIILFPIACGSPTQTTKVGESEKPASTVTAETKEETIEETTPQEFYLNDQVQFGKYVLSVDEIKRSKGSTYVKPKEGKEFVIVKVTITNNSDDKISYNPWDFKIQDSDGNITTMAFTMLATDTQLNAGELAPSGHVTGTIDFEVPKGDEKPILIFNPSWFSGEELKINLWNK